MAYFLLLTVLFISNFLSLKFDYFYKQLSDYVSKFKLLFSFLHLLSTHIYSNYPLLTINSLSFTHPLHIISHILYSYFLIFVTNSFSYALFINKGMFGRNMIFLTYLLFLTILNYKFVLHNKNKSCL